MRGDCYQALNVGDWASEFRTQISTISLFENAISDKIKIS